MEVFVFFNQMELQDFDVALPARFQHGTASGTCPAELRLAERVHPPGGGFQRREERRVTALLHRDGGGVATRVDHPKSNFDLLMP